MLKKLVPFAFFTVFICNAQGADHCKRQLLHDALTYEEITEDSVQRTPDAPYLSTEQFLAAVKSVSIVDQNPLFSVALAQAQKSHGAMTRQDGSSYLEQHIYPVTLSALRETLYNPSLKDVDLAVVVISALLHDSLEDDDALDFDGLERVYGAEIASNVVALTKAPMNLDTLEGLRKKWYKNYIYVSRLGRSNLVVQAVKLADRLNNIVSTLALFTYPGRSALTESDLQKAAFYVLETEEFYVPIAQRVSFHFHMRMKFILDRIKHELSLGAQSWEAQDLALRRRLH